MYFNNIIHLQNLDQCIFMFSCFSMFLSERRHVCCKIIKPRKIITLISFTFKEIKWLIKKSRERAKLKINHFWFKILYLKYSVWEITKYFNIIGINQIQESISDLNKTVLYFKWFTSLTRQTIKIPTDFISFVNIPWLSFGNKIL